MAVPDRLILVKHAAPAIVPGIPARQWYLSDPGRQSIPRLAQALQPFQPERIVTSLEPKAIETARLTAAALRLPWNTSAGLHEHDRSNEPYDDLTTFEDKIRLAFSTPDELVYGRETANQALARFQGQIDSLAKAHPEEKLAVVSHGTVISLFVAFHNSLDPFTIWKQLGLPSFAMLELPNFKLIELVSQISA